MPKSTQADRLRRAHETADLVGLRGFMKEEAGKLPHGLQRLVSVAIAFASRPHLLCLDEPLTGLNQTEVVSALGVFRTIRQDFGSSILFVEHNMKAVMQVCDRLYVLHHGQLLAAGTPDEVRGHPQVLQAYLGSSNVA